MAYPSLREKYQPVPNVPDDLVSLARRLKDGNARELLHLLLRNPSEVVLGEFLRERRLVITAQPISWVAEGWRGRLPRSTRRATRELSFYEVRIATTALRVHLKRYGLPYNIWTSCGTNEPSGGALARFRFGLVDIRRPLPVIPA